jgi:uncharacterized protein YbjT (DUF2867 family)
MDDNKLTAIVFGASGLTGRFVTEQLILDSRYGEIKLFVRKEIKIPSGKLRQYLFTPENIAEIESQITGDHLFCCLGSTIKKAGSKKAFFEIDHNMVEKIAKMAAVNKVKSFVVISSIGAKDTSGNFYLSTKGKMEESVKTFTFQNLSIVRPSILMGMRKEQRTFENIGKTFSKLFSPLMIGSLKKYKPIHSATVAKAMIELANRPKGCFVVESDELQELGKN